MRFDREKTRQNVRAASTQDLLDRATVWRDGMEPEVLQLIETELQGRGVRPADVEAHAERRAAEAPAGAGGMRPVCHRCERPAVGRAWVWGRLWRLLPMFPRRAFVCEDHRPGGATLR